MSSASVEQVRQFLLSRFAGQLAERGIAPGAVLDTLDLYNEGILDSLGLMELLAATEERFGIRIDYDSVDAEVVTVVGPFCEYIAQLTTIGA